MIIRAVSSYEVAEDPALVSRLKHLYNIIDSSVKPVTAQFPWVPGLATFRKLWASMSVYRIFNNAVHERKQSGVKRADTLQQLLDAEEGHQCILGVSPLHSFSIELPLTCKVHDGIADSWCAFHWDNRYVNHLTTILLTTGHS